jgi:hypothetical protein
MLIDMRHHIPFIIEDHRDAIAKINNNIKKDDSVYIYNMAYPTFKYYQDSGFLKLNNRVTIGSIHRKHNNRYDKELLSLNGKIWMTFAHVYRDEENYMINFLKKRGANILHKYTFSGSDLYYIDTTNMDRDRYYPYFVNGFHGWEGGKLGKHGWSSGDVSLILPNRFDSIKRYRLSFALTTIKDRSITIKIGDKEISHIKLLAGQKISIDKIINLNAGENNMMITTDTPSHKVGKDPRMLAFAIENLKYEVIK